jgi:transglutaminase-like putative cysteine protease
MLEIQREDLDGLGNFSLPGDANKFGPYLNPTPLIQSGDARIVSQAKQITKGSADAKAAARMLVAWVYKNIEKKPTVSIPSSLEVLDRRAGDCNEHTSLFVALARSLGLPARICVGIVYMENKFFYHAWPEVFLSNWVAVDPTFNQFPADATHIRFVIGDLSDQLKIVRLIGELKVEVMEYS